MADSKISNTLYVRKDELRKKKAQLSTDLQPLRALCPAHPALQHPSLTC